MNEPLRPIIASYGSVTSGCEEFLLKILSPLRAKCTYAVKSTLEFKNEFLLNRHKFDPRIHEISSYDAQSLFTSINVNRVLSYILKIIYEDPKSYFSEKSENEEGNIVENDKLEMIN